MDAENYSLSQSETVEALLAVLLDEDAQRARVDFCRAVCAEFENIATWLAIDTILGAGDTTDTSLTLPIEKGRWDGFWAISLVVQIAGELANGALSLMTTETPRAYATAALMRQALECEYLLGAFRLDFATATAWYNSSPADLRRDFKVFEVRSLGDFSAEE